MSRINCICILLKITGIFCFVSLLVACTANDSGFSSPDEDVLVPVTFSVKMDSEVFESSTEIIPMHTKSNLSETYNVVKFTGSSTLVVLKKLNAGWIVDKKIDSLYTNLELKNTDTNALKSPSLELRPGTYRFILFANSSKELPIKQNQLINDPSSVAVIEYGVSTNNKLLLGEEVFIAKTGDWDIKRNDSLNQSGKRTVELNLNRVVAMVRVVMTTMPAETFTKNISVTYSLTSKNNKEFCTGINLFGEIIKNKPLTVVYGITNIYTTPIMVDNRNFHFGWMDKDVTNRPRYLLVDDTKINQEYEMKILSCDDIEQPEGLNCTITLKRNTINGIVLLKDGYNYSCFEEEGKPYPVNFPSLPYSDYIEVNNKWVLQQ